MKTYTATNNKTNETFTFTTCDGNMAKLQVQKKFGLADVTIKCEETGEEFPLIDEWLSDTAYISRNICDWCKEDEYILYIEYDYPGNKGKKTFAPIVGVTREIVPETIINKFNEREADKSTHKIGNWYVGFPKAEIGDAKYAFLNFCEKYGKITFEEL